VWHAYCLLCCNALWAKLDLFLMHCQIGPFESPNWAFCNAKLGLLLFLGFTAHATVCPAMVRGRRGPHHPDSRPEPVCQRPTRSGKSASLAVPSAFRRRGPWGVSAAEFFNHFAKNIQPFEKLLDLTNNCRAPPSWATAIAGPTAVTHGGWTNNRGPNGPGQPP
jgi:hypothetical protein